MTKNIFLLVFVLQLSACTTGQWFKAGATEQEFREVNYLCLKESQQPASQATSTFNSKNLNGSVYDHRGAVAATPNAIVGGYGHQGYAFGDSKADFSSNYSSGMITNEKLFNACMNANGFYWIVKDNNYQY